MKTNVERGFLVLGTETYEHLGRVRCFVGSLELDAGHRAAVLAHADW